MTLDIEHPSNRKEFEVWIHKEPMSGTRSKRKYLRKAEFIKEIRKEKGEFALEAARKALLGGRVKISVRFNLLKLTEGHSDTTQKKDLDNMLKVVLDSLQQKADAQGKLAGLGLIANDEAVYRIEAVKRIVDRPEQVGTKLIIARML